MPYQGAMSVKYCTDKMSPSLRTALAEREFFTVAIKVKEGYEEKLKNYMERVSLREGLGVGRIKKENLMQLSCEPWVLFIDSPESLYPQEEKR